MKPHRQSLSPTERTILESLTAIRIRNGLTVREVARRMHCTSPSISQLELGHRRGRTVTLERLLRYAAAIGAEIHVYTPIPSGLEP